MKTEYRNYFLLPLLACLALAPAAASAGEPDGKGFPAKKVKEFFQGYIEKGEGTYEKSQPVKPTEIQAVQKEVWEAWVSANLSAEEEKLGALQDLTEKATGQWHLPAQLEPDATMNFYYGKKGAEKPQDGFPLFLYLHGSGDRQREWENGLRLGTSFEDSPSVYFIPQIPNTGSYYRWWQKAKQYAWEKLLRQALASGEVDSDRIYFFGISEGGYGSQRLASFYADYLAGAGPMAGGEPLKNAPAENCRNIAFSLRTGAEDKGFFRDILTGYTKEAFETLERQYPGGFAHNVELIPGYGHAIDYRPTTPWLARHTRSPYPKHVLWENYEMDGRYRKGFYNLYLEEDPRGTSPLRVFYKMDIEGNEIRLTVEQVAYTTVQQESGIEMKFQRSDSPLDRGKIRIYLNGELVDLSQPVTVRVNGKQLFSGKVTPDVKDMVNSCAAFYDPRRVFPASVLVDLGQGSPGAEAGAR